MKKGIECKNRAKERADETMRNKIGRNYKRKTQSDAVWVFPRRDETK
jgi:hypothetical protein